MRPAKILLRLKGQRSQAKAFVNVRDRDKSHPRQLHLGYINIHQDLDVAKSRLYRTLDEKWPRKRKPPAIDWEDAEKKLAKLRLAFGDRVRLSMPAVAEPSPPVTPTTPVPSQPEAFTSLDARGEPKQHPRSPPSWQAELVAAIPHLERVAFSMTGNAAEADDLVQITLENALRSQANLLRHERLTSWLFGIMHHRFFDMLRARIREDRRRIDIDMVELAYIQWEEEEEQWKQWSLADLRNYIHTPDWELLDLIYIKEHSYQEAAHALCIPINTLTSRLARARQRVRGLLASRRDS